MMSHHIFKASKREFFIVQDLGPKLNLSNWCLVNFLPDVMNVFWLGKVPSHHTLISPLFPYLSGSFSSSPNSYIGEKNISWALIHTNRLEQMEQTVLVYSGSLFFVQLFVNWNSQTQIDNKKKKAKPSKPFKKSTLDLAS